MNCLVIRHQRSRREIPLPVEGVRLGSAPDNDVVLRYPGVSKHHAQVVVTEEGLSLVDVGSKNGIIFNGNRVGSVPLTSGVQLDLGEARLSVEDLSTSDVVAALRIGYEPRADSAGETAEADRGAGAAAASSPGNAFRFVREAEQTNLDLSSHLALNRIRTILDAETVIIGERAPTRDIAISGLAGPLPTEEDLEHLRVGSLPLVNWSSVHGEGNRFIAAKGKPATWKREFLAFLAAKLFGQERKATGPHPLPLAIPDEMVIGPSEAMQRVFDQLQQTVHGDLDVLLRGETGTGKELFARLIHASGPASRGPFVAVNCAAIPAELMEAELFGVERRAATGVEPRKGLFREADGGSILLDEITELPLSLQAKLLRVLQEREVLPIGASRPQRIQIRVISSTNQDIDQFMREGQFRRDLFFRLRGLEFVIPPLREHAEDIPSLLLAMTAQASRKYDKNVSGITQRALAELIARPWTGNVRELKTAVERAVLLCAKGGALQLRHFEPLAPPPAPMTGTAVASAALGRQTVLQPKLDDAERVAIVDALRRANGNKSEAARLLGISRAALYLKIRRLNLS